VNNVKEKPGAIFNPHSHTILVIDDEPANLTVVVDYLANYGFQIKVARTGEAGLELARRVPPDLILLDVVLPGIDGFEVCRRLKADTQTKEIPVIFITIMTQLEDKVQGFEVGGVDYIAKPFQREEVWARVTTHLRLRDLTEHLEQQVYERTEELRKVTQAYKALSNCNQTVMRATEEEELLQEVCRIILRDCGYRLVWIGFAEHDQAKIMRPVAQAGYEEGYLETITVTWADTGRGLGPTGTAIRTKKPVINRDMLANPDFAPWRAEAIKRGYASSAALPLLTGEQEAIGALNVYAAEPDAFTSEEVALLLELAGDLAYGLVALRVRAAHARAAEALRESESRLRTLMDHIPAEVWAMNNSLHFTMQNAASTRIVGNVVGKRLEDLDLPAEAKARLLEQDRQVLDGKTLHEEYQVEMAGKPVAYENIVAPIKVDDTILGLVGVALDVTERKRAEEALKLNAERSMTLLRLNQMTEATLKNLITFAFEEAVRLTKSKIGYLAFLNADETVLTMQLWSRGAMAECAIDDKPIHYPVETAGLWGEAVRQRRPIITNTYAAPNPWKKGCPEGHVHLVRHMNVPVIVEDKIVLVAGVGNKEDD
jgi:PAS domain S-box-containing protein